MKKLKILKLSPDFRYLQKLALRISFTKKLSEFPPTLVNGNRLEVVRSAKLLGVIITSDLSWKEHVNETVKRRLTDCISQFSLKGQGFHVRIYSSFMLNV